MREHRDIAEFEARTKIRAKYLRALEDEEWALLPGYTFAKAFLRTYADMLGLDGRMLVDEFKRQYQDPSELELAPVLPARGDARRSRERPADHPRERDRDRDRRRRPAGPSTRVLAVALLVVLIAAALFIVHELRKKSPAPAHTTTTQTTTTKTTTHHAPAAPHKVALALVASAPVTNLPDRLPDAHRRRRRARERRARPRRRATGLPRRQPLPRQLRRRRGAHGHRRALDQRRRQHRAGLLRDLPQRALPRAAGRVGTALHVSARAAIVVTGTELVSGRVSDRNGPWLAARLGELGIDPAHTTIVGDRPADMLAALQWSASLGVSLIVTSGGLGPTADDLTATVVGEFCGREMVLDAALEERIAAILLASRGRWRQWSEEAIREANRKQAVIPAGATVLEPGRHRARTRRAARGGPRRPDRGRAARTAARAAADLGGWPREPQAFADATRDATVYEQRVLRLFGLPESEIATTLREAQAAGVELERLEVTTCVRSGELEIVTRYEPAGARDRRCARGRHPRAPRARHLLRRRQRRRRAGGGRADRAGPDRRRRRILHRRPDAGAA